MEMRNLGATGMKVSSLCLGTMMFGPIGNNDRDDCIRIIHRALDAGINFVDTADVYSQGISEQIVGAALKDRREHVVLATKFFHPMGEDLNQRGGSRRWIVKAVENSLKRLGTDYIDLYQMHRFDSVTDLDETLFALTDLVRQGKIRSFGSSCFPADRIVQAQWVADRRGHLPFPLRAEQLLAVQSRDRALRAAGLPAPRHGHDRLVAARRRLSLGQIPRDAGYCRRKPNFRFQRMFRGSFDPEAELFQRKKKLHLVGELAMVADEAALPMAQLAVAFAIEHPAVTSAIIGPRTMDHLESLLAVGEMKLAPAILDRIDALVPPGTSVNPIADVPNALGRESPEVRALGSPDPSGLLQVDVVEVAGVVTFGQGALARAVDQLAALHAGPLAQQVEPAPDVLVLVRREELGGTVGAAHDVAVPGIDGDVGDRVLVADDVFFVGQMLVEHVQLPLGFHRIAVDRILDLERRIGVEMTEAAADERRRAHLPHQPVHRLGAFGDICRQGIRRTSRPGRRASSRSRTA